MSVATVVQDNTRDAQDLQTSLPGENYVILQLPLQAQVCPGLQALFEILVKVVEQVDPMGEIPLCEARTNANIFS
jgi:hypothetical protein